MISNFSKFKKSCPLIHEKIRILENKIEDLEFPFPLEVRKITESLIDNEPLKQFVLKDEKEKSFNESLLNIFSSKNTVDILKITKNFQNTKNLQNSFHEIKNIYNPLLHYQDQENFNNHHIDKDKKINLLSKLYTILNIVYFGKSGFDFKPSIYFSQDFLSGSEVKKIFNSYKSKRPFESNTEKFLYFLTDEVIDDFYENYNFDLDDIENNNLITKDDLIYLEFLDQHQDKLFGILSYPNLENYKVENLEDDLKKINKLNYFKSRITQKLESYPSTIYIVSPNVDIEVKDLLNQKMPLLKREKIEIKIMDEKNILDNYFYKNQEKAIFSNFSFQLEEKNRFFEIQNQDYRIIMANILGGSIANAWEQTRGTILKKNLRGYIKNKKIDDSIRETMYKEPQNFSLYNNGITAIANKKNGRIIDGNLLRFDEFYIINGGQTAKLMSDFYRDKVDKNDNLSVLLKIIVPSKGLFSQEIIDKVSVTSNRQKPIKVQDLWATDKQLQKWVHTFLNVLPDFTFSIKRDSTEKHGKKSLDLPFFIQLAVSTIKADPYTAKNHKSKILGDEDLVRDILKTINLDMRQIQNFIYDILMINNTIDNYLKKLKKPHSSSLIDDSANKITILKSGRLFIISLLYLFHLIKKLSVSEQNELILSLRNSTTQDKNSIFKRISEQKPIEGVLNRGLYSENQKANFFEPITETNLGNLISKIVDELLEKTKWSVGNTDIDFDWMKIFKQGERGWKLAIPFIEKFIKSRMSQDNTDFNNFTSDNLIYLIENTII